jgi:hypothetical protein
MSLAAEGRRMPQIIRMPINNSLMGSDYTGRVLVGGGRLGVDVILDTGSSTLAVDGRIFDPTKEPATKTTKLAQAVQYGSGSWVGAVVQTPVGLSPSVSLRTVNIAVTYTEAQGVFGKAGGILGLAYPPINNAFVMSGDSWQAKYDADQLAQGRATNLDPYFSQLEQADIVANRFAFYTKRSIVRVATADPASDPQNQGTFVIGGGPECKDLYIGPFHNVAVLDDVYYNTNLLAVQVGHAAPIRVPPPGPGSTAKSNSIVDSGTNALVFAEVIYAQVLTAFASINPDYPGLLQNYSVAGGQGVDQRRLDVAAWPAIALVLQGAAGSPVSLRVTAWNYWQMDAAKKGIAIASLCGDGGRLGGQSVLGLPLISQYFAVFDRSAAGGHGTIQFANRR